MSLWIAFIITAATIFALSRRLADPGGRRSAEPTRPPRAGLWRFEADLHCERGRRRVGELVHGHERHLPAQPCEAQGCGCRYVPVAERRRTQRRLAADRRDTIRFEKTSDRRNQTDRRRDCDLWLGRSV
ncbi:MAG: hypothetical protein AAGE01_00250 [Pseudomonadota bacterium]